MLSIELLSNAERSESTDQQNDAVWNNHTYLLILPVDIRMLIIGYLQKKDIHSLVRSCKSNLDACKQWIYNLISTKFDYLLRHNCSTINIKHLLNVPFVDPIAMNVCDMALYFQTSHNKSITSSKYIGIDANTSHAFLSFWMKKMLIDDPQSDIITVVFNKTSVDYFHFSDPCVREINAVQFCLLGNNNLDISEINSVLLTGKIIDTFSDGAVWCLNDKWESHMLWPRIKAEMTSFGRPVTIIYLIILLILWIISMMAWLYLMTS